MLGASRLQLASHNGATIVRFDDLDPASWLLASCDQVVATQKIVEVLNPLREQAPLLETLQSYFAVNMNVAEAALRLNVVKCGWVEAFNATGKRADRDDAQVDELERSARRRVAVADLVCVVETLDHRRDGAI